MSKNKVLKLKLALMLALIAHIGKARPILQITVSENQWLDIVGFDLDDAQHYDTAFLNNQPIKLTWSGNFFTVRKAISLEDSEASVTFEIPNYYKKIFSIQERINKEPGVIIKSLSEQNIYFSGKNFAANNHNYRVYFDRELQYSSYLNYKGEFKTPPLCIQSNNKLPPKFITIRIKDYYGNGDSLVQILKMGRQGSKQKLDARFLAYRKPKPMYNWQHRQIGGPGQEGESGAHGSHGESQKDLLIDWRQDAPRIDISGQNGQAGAYGMNGTDAFGCRFPLSPREHIEGAIGGDAGAGGDGGHGGDAGNLLVFNYEEQSLQNWVVKAKGGRGGVGGYPGAPGQGCVCNISSWTRYYQESNQYLNSSCQSGGSGKIAPPGKTGRNGRDGALYLIPTSYKKEDVLKENPKVVAQVGHATSHKLSKNRWQIAHGARELLHPDSVISAEYYLYKGKSTQNIEVEWRASRPVGFFGSPLYFTRISGSYPHEFITISFSKELWIEGQWRYRPNSSTYLVNEVFWHKEIEDSHVSALKNSAKGFVLEIKVNPITAAIPTFFKLSFALLNQNHHKIKILDKVIEGKMAKEEPGLFYIDLIELGLPARVQKSPNLLLSLDIGRGTRKQSSIKRLVDHSSLLVLKRELASKQ